MKTIRLCTSTLLLLFFSMLTSYGQHNFNHAYSIGGAGQENLGRSLTDYDGYMYLYGSFSSPSIDVAPGATTVTLNNQGGEDALLVKYDTAGMYLMSIPLAGNFGERINDVIVDPSGIYVCGFFNDTVDFDPSPATYNLISPSGIFGSFVAKFNPSGGLIWAKAFTGWSQANAICFTTGGNLCVVGIYGSFTGMDADPGAGTVMLNGNGAHECFCIELTTSGNYVQSASWGGGYLDKAYDVAKMNGNIVIAGAFSDTCDFAPDSSSHVIMATGDLNGYVLSLNSNFQFNWVYTIPSQSTEFKCVAEHQSSTQVVASTDYCLKNFDGAGNNYWTVDLGYNAYIQSLFFMPSGDIMAAGVVGAITDFDPDTGYSFVYGGINVFWAAYSLSWGQLQFVKSLHGNGTIAGMGSTPDGRFNISGAVYDSIDFNPASGVTMITTSPIYTADLYISQYQMCTPVTMNYTMNLCSGDTAILNGLHFVATEFSPGYAQLVCLEFNQAYTPTEKFSWIDNSENGCDTIRIVNVTGIPAVATTQTLTICGGDSVVVGSNVYTSSGTYIDLIPRPNGCDSTVTTSLTVNTVDTSLTVSWSTLWSNAAGATYQWIDCSTGNPIAGATAFSYTATADGEYACVVTQNSCTDTSGCYTMTEVGINETASELIVSCYPNPVHDLLTVTSNSAFTEIRILDLTGRIVSRQNANAPIAVIDLSALTVGSYIVEVIAGDLRTTQRITRE